ncbi:hypothetical protein QYE76_027013 [Lolium multiflorum]|uniref:Uncharacterized protein n=1 Tax=Lolium multiflorum TaxID=4521 RepID=A0AAD8UVV5_LOLMU|nr:hypothetical protein QYE76_027013 [Lolium multiflorum]
MVKKKNPSAAASSTSGGAAAKYSSILSKEGAQRSCSAPPAPPSSAARPGDWVASITKRDEKRSRSLGLISSDEGNVIFPAAEETRAPPTKRSIGGFADEDDLLDFDDAFIEPPSKRVRSDAVLPAAAASEASAPKAAPAAQASTASSLSKGKDAPAAAAAPPSDLRGVISSLEAFASQFTSLEADKIRLQEEAKSSSSKLDGAIKKAAVARQEVDSLKEELNKLKERLKEEEARATEKDEVLHQSALALLEAASIPATALDKIPSNSPANGVSTVLAAHQLTRELLDKGKVIALNRAEENKRIYERVHALTQLSSAEEIFWREHSKASAVAQFQDRVQQVHHFFDKCYKAMRVVWKTMFRLNAVPPTLLALMSEFGSAKKIRDLVRAQVFAGARFTLALVLARYPSAGLLSIANVTGDLEALYPKVLLPPT